MNAEQVAATDHTNPPQVTAELLDAPPIMWQIAVAADGIEQLRPIGSNVPYIVTD